MTNKLLLKEPCRVTDASVMKRTLTIIIAGLTAAFALGACGAAADSVAKSAKSAIENATGCKVDGSDKSAKVQCKDKNGNGSFSVGSGATVPDGFPTSEVPLPSGKIVSSIATEVNGKPAYNVTVKVDGSVTTAADAYKQALKDKGFTIDENSSFSLGSGSGLTAFQVRGTSWDVNVIGAGGTAGSKSENALVVTVTSHTSTTETTDTTDTSSPSN